MAGNDIKILIADDTPVNIQIIKKYLEPRGFTVVIAENGQEAIDQYIATSPDIILMDVMMPIKTGYDATREIKALAGDQWVPVIFLSAKISIEDQIIGLNIGADAYFTKPVNLELLNAKLSAMLRIVEMQRKLNVVSEELQKFADNASDEIELAKQLMLKMGDRKESVRSESVRIFSEAAEDISGDIALSFQCENPAKRYFALADATGHGLAAAISIIPFSQLFYRLSSQSESVKFMVNEMNTRLEAILPPDRFVAATLGFVDREKQTIEVWNGANPSPLVISKNGDLLHSFEEKCFCLGVVSDDAFVVKTQTYHYKEDCEILFFSDGVIDAQNTQGQVFGNDGIIQSTQSPLGSHKTMFDKINADLSQFRDHTKRIDDICMLSVSIST